MKFKVLFLFVLLWLFSWAAQETKIRYSVSIPLSIDSMGISPSHPVVRDSVQCFASVSGSPEWVNFTITDFAGTKKISNINGTYQDGLWLSPSFKVMLPNTWNCSVVAGSGSNTETSYLLFMVLPYSDNLNTPLTTIGETKTIQTISDNRLYIIPAILIGGSLFILGRKIKDKIKYAVSLLFGRKEEVDNEEQWP